MVYNTQNCWAYGHCPSLGILSTRNHSISETRCVSVLRLEGETSALLSTLEKASVQ
jgi:hypothetical protein